MQVLGRRRISEISPNRLIKNPIFWIKTQKDFLIILLASLVVIAIFFRYTYSGFSSYLSSLSNVFNLCIHLIGIWGVIVAAKAIATVEVERAIANEIKENGEKGIREKRNVSLSKLEENYLPVNKTEPSLAMPRLFRHISKEAVNLRFESSIDVVEPYRDEALESLFTLTNIQKIALRAGILGTFIGLLEAITQLAKLDSSQNPTDAIITLSNALFISFSTSVAGLEVAILLGFLLMILRKRQNDYFRDMESSVEIILILARNADNDDQSRILGELAKVESVVEKLGQRLYENTQEIQRSIAAVLERIKEQTTEIQSGVQQLRQTKSDFDQFIDEVGETQNRFIGEVKGIYSELSLKSFRDDIKDGIVFAGQTVSSRLGETEKSIKKQTEQVNEGVNALLETRVKFTSFLQQLDSSQARFIENVKESQDIVAMVQASAELKATINRAVQRMEEASMRMKAINESLEKPLIERIKRNFFG
ncbi:MAG: MotA/TolQ/ExbB proton channel family protein [Microcystis sp. LE19-131.1A]|uniref:MotA/TolQ/ExbB proton channel family protein n=1 Tax=Microcystis sp. LE19-131.1A TaxID=3016439 RepID=UPI0022CAE3A2|nr:MotA/TolQ/ExbB proton channel family protein [Microcystis sp. LE19-131.1A]MCZ8244161.1 MotA/TolQ/ExbB proton channel family protein [Microcystis sp. LE19-131.1A]